MARLTTVRPRVQPAPSRRLGSATISETQRTRGTTWMVIRERILTRDDGLCCACRSLGRVSIAQVVDHDRPLWAGGTDADENLQSLCVAHHGQKTALEAGQRARGQWEPWTPADASERPPGG